jgi:large subunit ribosomal protein L17
MRHRLRGKKLSRHHHHRKALFKNLIKSLIDHGEIKTTESKAKAVRILVEKLITKGKAGTVQTRRLIGGFLQSRQAVNRLVDEIAPLFKSKPGGYTRITRLGERKGDNAVMVKLELVEKPAKREKPEEKENPVPRKSLKPLKSRKSLKLKE